MGYKSTLDPLFRADKLMIRATPLVAEAKQEAYGDAVDRYMEKAQMGSTMAYTSSWGEANPNGSKEVIEILLEEARTEVKATQAILGQVIELLELPPASHTLNRRAAPVQACATAGCLMPLEFTPNMFRALVWTTASRRCLESLCRVPCDR